MIIIGIISSSQEEYKEFKQIWIDNINYIKSEENKNKFEFYFLNSERGEKARVDKLENYYELYDDYTEDIRQRRVLKKTFGFFEHIKSKMEPSDYVIRTNLSTFMDLKVLLKWVKDKPTCNFFAGPFVGEYYKGKETIISGIHLLLTFDVMCYILNKSEEIFNYLNNVYDLNKDKQDASFIKYYIEDDNVISNVINNGYNEISILNVPRLSIVELKEFEIPLCGMLQNCKLPLYNKENKVTSDIYVYRFKTHDRDKDILRMKYLYKEIYKNNFNIIKYCNDLELKFYKKGDSEFNYKLSKLS